MNEDRYTDLQRQVLADIAWRRSRQAYVREGAISAMNAIVTSESECTKMAAIAIDALDLAEALADEVCKREIAAVIVIFAIHPDKSNFTVTTYGETKKLCKLAAGYGSRLADSVFGAALSLQKEADLVDIPERPCVFDGQSAVRGELEP